MFRLIFKFTTTLLIFLLGSALVISACKQRGRKVEIKPRPNDTAGDAGDDTGGEGDLASIAMELTKEQLAPHLDLEKEISLSVDYAGVHQESILEFVEDKANVVIGELPTGITEKIILGVYEAGTQKLTGELLDITLQPGLNTLEKINLTVVVGGGEDSGGDADLIIEILFPNQADATTSELNLTFADDIKARADKFCRPCHLNANVEFWWDANINEIKKRLASGAANPMPPKDSPQGAAFTTSDRDVFLKWMNQ